MNNIKVETNITQRKIGILIMHTAPYQDPVINRIREGNKENEVYAVFKSNFIHEEWNLKKTSYTPITLEKKIKLPVMGIFQPDILKVLHKNKFDLVMCCAGYYPATALVSVIFSIITKTPYILAIDTVYEDRKGGLKNQLRSKFVSALYNQAAAIWVPGKASRDYLSRYVTNKLICEGSYMLDGEEVLKKVKEAEPFKKKLRRELSIKDDDFLFLFVGKLIPTRNIKNLLKGFYDLVCNKSSKEIALLIIGDGPEVEFVEEFIGMHNQLKIRHIPSVEYDNLHQYYACADAYVHPGQEPYSLAFVEAVIAGIPVIATKGVGSAHDYLRNGTNGFWVEIKNSKQLTTAMEDVVAGKILKENIEHMQRYAIYNRNPEWVFRQVAQMIDTVLRAYP